MIVDSEKKEYIDDLTNCYNRRYLKKMQCEIEEFQEKNVPFSLAMVDIDYFKDINDTHGHLKGDEVINKYAQFMKDALRTSDIVIRYGGDEFVCIMPNTTRSLET
jgi:diguanylate cyclase (GGDEF)-like protein